MNKLCNTFIFFVLIWLSCVVIVLGQKKNKTKRTNLIEFHNISEVWEFSKGEGAIIAVLDWMFDIRSDTAGKYIYPVSLIPGQDIGVFKPWHGEWMAEIIHIIAPECKIIPIRARPKSRINENRFIDRPYEKYIIQGIKYAADHGAIAVINSMGPLRHSSKLNEIIQYASQKGTVFIDVHPEYIGYMNNSYILCDSSQLNPLIIHSGIISVPEHPREPDTRRDIYTWPYKMNPKYKDGWGYSNGPPIIAGVIALMKSVNNELTIEKIKDILIKTARMENGFRVLDAAAAVKEAIKIRQRK
ncbi:MAG: hypothetical protein Kow00108_16900 [Calditrichia bacterium]